MHLPPIDDPAWNAERERLEKAMMDAIVALLDHNGGLCAGFGFPIDRSPYFGEVNVALTRPQAGRH